LAVDDDQGATGTVQASMQIASARLSGICVSFPRGHHVYRGKLLIFDLMNVLSLYQKAQSMVLDARELAWVENEAREHPYFGLPYMISARHHLSQKTTVKDRALLMGAAYCMDRAMLHGYVQDLLQQPRAAKHVSVVATASDSIVESVATPVVEEVVAVAESLATPVVEEVVAVAESVATPVVEEVVAVAESVATPVVEEVVAVAESVAAPIVEEAPIVAKTGAIPVVEEAPIVAETVATPAVEEALIVAETVATPVVEQAPIVAETVATPTQAPDSTPQYTPRGINWFLNMRLKLRTQKYAGLPNRIRTAAAAHDASQRDLPAASTEATTVAAPETLPETPQVAPNTTLQAEGGKTKEDGYSIGAFSSFSFVETDDDSPEGLEENLVMSREAISLHTPTQPEENGEIVLEEENRTVEVIVSPELLAKYFNGHLPAHPASAAEEQPERMHLEFLPQDAPQVPPTPVRPPVVPVKRATPSAQDLIDRFIEQEPSIKRQGGVDIAPGDLARESNVERDEWVTETLARIYAKQGNKNKAIKIYQKLGLLFPEKRDYFAARIAELK
jgi:hypothetical protein